MVSIPCSEAITANQADIRDLVGLHENSSPSNDNAKSGEGIRIGMKQQQIRPIIGYD